MFDPTLRQSARLALTLCCALFCFLTPEVKATHIMGSSITYECQGGNIYFVKLKVWRDCSGAGIGNGATTINATSTCGGGLSVQLDLDSVQEVTQLCDSLAIFSTCNNGFLPGVQEFSYSGLVVLTPACNSWTLNWQLCCANGAINYLGQPNYYTEVSINTANGCNDSPKFTATHPIPSVCANQPATINAGAIDAEGDSLVYSFDTPLSNFGVNMAGYALPTGATIDSTTGIISWTPTFLGFWLFDVRVDQYDSTGVYLGWNRYTFEVNVMACTNLNPVADTLAPLVGCTSQPTSFTLWFTDPDSLDTLTYTSNINTIYPGAVVTDTLIGDTLWITATIPAGTSVTGSQTLLFTADDGGCPVPGMATSVVSIDLLQGISAVSDVVICGPQSAQLGATGSAGNYSWTAISGDPVIINLNFSCNPCQNPVATPSQTTTYVVTGTSLSGCQSTDTVVVEVVPAFSSTISAPNACLVAPTQISTILSPPGNYTFQWSPAAVLDNATIANPQATFSTPGANTVQVTITDASGCVQQDSVVIQVANAPAPNLATTAQPSVVFCPGASTQLSATVDTTALFSGGLCQTSSSPCSNSTIYGTVGLANLTNTVTSYPAPYGNFFHGAKHQYLLRADELIAGGVQPGNLYSLAFYVESLGNQTNYDNFTLLLGCTSDSVMTNWHSGLTTVFPAQSVTIGTGWNHHQFAQSYVWDGTSNLVVEVCFNNGFFTSNGNARTRYTPTGYSSTLYYFADVPSVCSSPAAPQISTSRANMRFGQCGLVPNQNDYTFTWGPQGSVTSPNQASTGATVNGTTSYWVTATDTTTGCSSTDTVTVTLDSVNVIDSLSSTMLTCPGSNDGTISVYSSHPGVTGYSIDNGATIQPSGQFTGLAAGTYTVQIYSGTNCFISYMIFVGTVAPVNAVMSNDTSVCSGSLVTVTAQGYGGHGGPYSYQWSFGQTQSSVTFPATSSGTYTVTITDSQGCTGTDSVEVLIYPNLVASFTPNTWVQSGDSTTLCISASGGLPAYTYSWSTGSTDSCITVTPAVATSYTASVSDFCTTQTQTIEVSIAPVSVQNLNDGVVDFKAYPNPYRHGTTLQLTTAGPTPVQLDILNLVGKRVALLADGTTPAGEHRFDFQAEDLPPGIYLARLNLNGSQRVIRLVQVR